MTYFKKKRQDLDKRNVRLWLASLSEKDSPLAIGGYASGGARFLASQIVSD